MRALDLGVNLFDTANIYGQGDSEKVIGSTFRSRRDEVVIITKAGYPMPPMSPAKRLAKPLLRPVARRLLVSNRVTSPSATIPNRADRFDPTDLRSSLEGSLRRLQTDHVDIFMLHSIPDDLLDQSYIHSFLASLKQEGKVRAVGYSMTRFPRDVDVMVDDHVDVVGSAVNMTSKENLEELDGLADRDIPVIAYQVFGSGQLLGVPGSSPQQHLRFALEQPGVVSAVAGASSVRQLEQNVQAVETLAS